MFARLGYSLANLRYSSFPRITDAYLFSRLNDCASKHGALSMENRLQARLAVAPFLANAALSFLIAEYPFYHSEAVAQRLVEVVKGNACFLSPQDCMTLMLLQLKKEVLVKENSTFVPHFSGETLGVMFTEIEGRLAFMQDSSKNPVINEDDSFSEGTLEWTKEFVVSEKDICKAHTHLMPISETLIRCLLVWLTSSHKSFGTSTSHGGTLSSYDNSAPLPPTTFSHSTRLYRLQVCAVLLAFLDADFISGADDIRKAIEVHFAPPCLSQYFTAKRMDGQGSRIVRSTMDELLIALNNAWLWWELHLRLGPLLPLDLARRTLHECWEAQWSFQRQVLSAAPWSESLGMATAARFLRIVSFFLAHIPLLCHLPSSVFLREGDISSMSFSHSSLSNLPTILSFLQLLLPVVQEAVRVAREGWGWPPAINISSILSSFDGISEAENEQHFGQTANPKVPNQHFDRELLKLLLSMVHHLISQWTVFSAFPASQGSNNNDSDTRHFGAFEAMSSTVFRVAGTVADFFDFISPSLEVYLRFVNGDDEKIWIQMMDLVMWMERFNGRQSDEHHFPHLSPHELPPQDVLPLEALFRLKRILLSTSVRYLFLADAYYKKVNEQGDIVSTRCSESTGDDVCYTPSHCFLTAFVLAWQEWIARLSHSSTLHEGFINELQREFRSHYDFMLKTAKSYNRGHANLDDLWCSNPIQARASPDSLFSTVKPVEGDNLTSSLFPSLPTTNKPARRFFTESTLLEDLLLNSWSRYLRLVDFDTSLIFLFLNMTTLMKLQAESPSYNKPHEVECCFRGLVDKTTSGSGHKLGEVSPFPIQALPVSVFLSLFHKCTCHIHNKFAKLNKKDTILSISTTTPLNVSVSHQSLCMPALITFCAKWGGLVDSLCAVDNSPRDIFSTPSSPSPLTGRHDDNPFPETSRRGEIHYVNVYPPNYFPLWDVASAYPFLSILQNFLHAADAEAAKFEQLLGFQFCEITQSAEISQEYLETMLDIFISSIHHSSSSESVSFGNLLVPCIFCVCGVPTSVGQDRSGTFSSLGSLQVMSFFIWQQTRKVLWPQAGDVFEQQPSVQLFFRHQNEAHPNAPTTSSAMWPNIEWGRSPYIDACFNHLQIDFALHYLVFVLSEAFSLMAEVLPKLSHGATPHVESINFKTALKHAFHRNRTHNSLYRSLALQRPDAQSVALRRSQKRLWDRACPALRSSVREGMLNTTVCVDQGNEMISTNVRLFVSSYGDWCLEALWKCLCTVGQRFQRLVEEDWMRTIQTFDEYRDDPSGCPTRWEKHSPHYSSLSSYYAYIRERLLDSPSESPEFTEKDGNDDEGTLQRWHAVRTQVCLLEPWIKSMTNKCFFISEESTTQPFGWDGDRSKSPSQRCAHVLTPSQARLLLRTLFQFPEATFLTFSLDLLRSLWDSAASSAREANSTHPEGPSLPSPEDLDELAVWLLWIALAESLRKLEEEVCAYVVTAFSEFLSSPKGKKKTAFKALKKSPRFRLHGLSCASPMELLEMATTADANSRSWNFSHHKDKVDCVINTERSSTALANFSLNAVYTYYYVMGKPYCGMQQVIRVLLMNSQSVNGNNTHVSDDVPLFSRQEWYLDRLKMIIGLAR
ncbi:unnamed protein product [Phytomonas sp. Hart1]|nr:unnamed protein product [Phytomonas sp. Hart1]|eukprot:CCW70172.1 unnamed protein product [Phytomonas sp. isolate Hart1]